MKRQVRCFLYKRLANSYISDLPVKSYKLKSFVEHKLVPGRESAIVNREWLANFKNNLRSCAVRNSLPIADCRFTMLHKKSEPPF